MSNRHFWGVLATIAIVAGSIGTYIAYKNNRAARMIEEERRERIIITENDHRLGAATPKVIIVEYGETECPYCKEFHPILTKVTGEHPEVAWVYRHFPLPSRPKSLKEAQALECAWEEGGNDAFWNYLALIFKTTPSNNNLDLSLLPILAEKIGLSSEKLESCIATDRHLGKIENDKISGLALGVNQVPYTFIIAVDGREISFVGSRGYDFMEKVIKKFLEPPAAAD